MASASFSASRVVYSLAFLFVCIAFLVAYIAYLRARVALRIELAKASAGIESLTTASDGGVGNTEAFSRSLVDALADSIFVAQDHRFVYCNAALPRMLGFAHEEFVGMPFEAVVAPAFLPLWTARFDQRIGAGPQPMGTYELQFLVKDRSRVVDVELTATRSIFDGRPAVVGMLRDITERRQVEAELDKYREHLKDLVAERTDELERAFAERAESQNFAQTICDNQPTLLAYVDRSQQLQFANRAVLQWFGKSRGADLGRTLIEVLGKPGIGGGGQEFVARVLAGETLERHLTMRDSEGREGEFLTYLLPDGREDGVKGYYFIATDITALKNAERDLTKTNEALVRSRDEAETATRAKSAFLANMSHEIRTPMNAILGLTHLVRRNSAEGENSKRLGRISDAANHLLSLIDGILDLSKIESGKFELEEVEFELDAMLSRAFGMVTESARDKGIELVIDSDHVPHALRGDPTRLAQALVNLLGNAIKFTSRGSVSLLAQVVADQSDRLKLRFEVHDTGPGIAPESLGRLFTAFEQADASTTRRFGGTGLGLVITRHLARLMHGDAGASSEIGVGSVFWITVELGRGKRAAEPAEQPLGGNARFLLVDDLYQARDALARMMRRQGLRTTEASSGRAALSLALAASQAGDPYTVLFVDWLMPGMDGIELVEEFRRLGLGLNATVVILTTLPAPRLQSRKEELGVAVILDKPVSNAALRGCLEQLFSEGGLQFERTVPSRLSEQLLRTRHLGARILLAEDNPVNQEVARSLMEQAGLRVDVAQNGREAVALASATPYALILMDMQMPEMDGMEATRQLRTVPGTRRTPIIAITANAYLDDRKACLDAGMNDFLTKPVEPSHLYSLLAKWMEARVPE